MRYLPALILLVSTHVYGGFTAVYREPSAPKASVKVSPKAMFITSTSLSREVISCIYADADQCLDTEGPVLTNAYASKRGYNIHQKAIMFDMGKRYYILEVSKP